MTYIRPAALSAALCTFAGSINAQTDAGMVLSRADAIAIALKEQQGTIAEAERDEHGGRIVYDIEVLTDSGEEIEFKIDAETGEILDRWTDDDPSDDPETSELDGLATGAAELEVVASSAVFSMNGVTVTPDKRVFVSIPQWTETASPSVAEVLSNGDIKPYPGGAWNNFDPTDPMDRFVNVNAVHSDGAGSLWVVDYAGPNFGPSIDDAQKLVQIDLSSNQVTRVYRFDEDVLPQGARLNDVRVDAARGVAYVSEFGVGAIIVVDLDSGTAFRALDQHYSTRAHPDVMSTFLGKPFRTDFLHVNDIELSPDGAVLYYQPTGGPIMWQIPTRLLSEPLENSLLEPHVAVAGKSMTIGGMTRNEDGLLYLGSVQDNAVWALDPDSGETYRLLQDDRLLWPDAMSLSSDGYLYIPAPQLRLLPALNDGSDLTQGDFAVYRVALSEIAK